ncbi:MAG: hypothetical protein C0507_05385 [Cyanobacteria bacterium PR.3.49]|nr:hypothetical protein [Cyanobacteria bacterium PR.3.49]
MYARSYLKERAVEETKKDLSPFAELIRYAIWCAGALVVWIILSLFPAVRDFQPFYAWFNLVMFLSLLPALLLAVGMGHYGINTKYLKSSFCVVPAVIICEFLNLIPFNPFAIALPFCLACQSQNFAGLGHFKASELLARRALSFWGEDSGVHPQWQMAGLIMVAGALQGQGRYCDADKLIQAMFKIADADKSGTELQAVALTDFAGSLSRLGRAKEALEVANRAMEIWHSLPDLSNDQLSIMSLTMVQLGHAYENHGNFKLALEWYRKALSINLQTSGEECLESAGGFSNVGYVLTEIGQLEEASVKLEHARELMLKLEMENTSSWAHLTENLGDLYRAMGKFEEAENTLFESVKLREKRFKQDLHHSYHDLGKLYRDKKDWEKSIEYFEKTLSMREKRFVAPTIQTLREFAKLMESMDRQQEAKNLEARADELMSKIC